MNILASNSLPRLDKEIASFSADLMLGLNKCSDFM